MAINKVEYAGRTLIDLTDTTATAEELLTGYGAYRKDGVWIDGSLVVQHYYTGTTAPSSSLGENGDIYLQT